LKPPIHPPSIQYPISYTLLHDAKKFLSNNFEIKDMSEASYVIGIEIFHYGNPIIVGTVSEGLHLKKLLERFKMKNCCT
jgi:hypothetical protein